MSDSAACPACAKPSDVLLDLTTLGEVFPCASCGVKLVVDNPEPEPGLDVIRPYLRELSSND